MVAALPPELYAPYLELIDRDDSVHPLTGAQLGAIRAGFAALAVLFGILSGLLAWKRRRVQEALVGLRADIAALLPDLRVPSTIPFAIILLIGLLVRVAILDGPMRFDESDTFDYFATRSYFNTLTDYTAPNNHILHTLLVRTSYLLFGDSPAAIRFPALLAGMLALPATFLLTRRLFDERAAYFAMALAAGHPALIHYSANARGYTLLCLWTLAVLLAASELYKRSNWFAWLVFTAAGALGMFTIPVMLYPLSGASLWALWDANRQRRKTLAIEIVASAAVIVAASVAFYAPAAARTGLGTVVANRYVSAMSWDVVRVKVRTVAGAGWALWTDHLSTPVLLALVLALAAGLRGQRARRLAVSLLAAALGWMVMQRVVPYARVFTYLAPVTCLIAAAGWRRLSPRPMLAAIASLALAVHYWAGYVWFPTRQERLQRELASWTPRLLEQTLDGTKVYAPVPLSEPIRYRFLRAGRKRAAVLAPGVGNGKAPAIASDDALIVVRPIERDSRLGYRVDLTGPAFDGFSATAPLLRGELVEALRLER